MTLKDKVMVVTGSTTGIGEVIVRHAIKQGAKVTIHGREEKRAKSLAVELGTSNVHYFLGELAQPEVCSALIADTINTFGTIDILINNAALVTRSDIITSDAAFFDHMMAVNLRAPMLLSQQVIAHLRKRKKKGSILNIGSINAYCGQPNLLVYSMTKGGLMTMTRNLGDSLGLEGIRVNQLNVGWTLTPNEHALKKREGLSDDWHTRVPSLLAPSGQLLTPENIAEHVMFWVSDLSAPITGCVIDVEQYPLIGRNRISDHQF